jgi:ketosteroid isomerase-like protein
MPVSDVRSKALNEHLAANKATIRRFFEAWTNGDFDRVEKMIDPNGEWWTLAKRQARPVPLQLGRIRALHAETQEGISFRLDTMTAEEDRVAAVVESYTDFADQGVYNNLYHFLFRVVDGLILDIKVYYDTALANRVLRGAGGTRPVGSHASD